MKKFFPLVLLMPLLLQCSAPANTGDTLKDAVSADLSGEVGYEIFVRSFYDSNGDGIGDLKGIIQKLDYLNDGDSNTTADLGVTVVWLMPINPSPSYHGYDVTDYYGIESDYGTMDDFTNLIAQAKKRGIRIVMDLVINHTSSDHSWFKKSASLASGYEDWYVWTDKTIASLDTEGWKMPWGGGSASDVWHYNSTRKAYFYGAFWSGMPDLNYKSAAVKEEMKNVAKFWLNKGVAGFRLDAARYVVESGAGTSQADVSDTLSWWREFEAAVRSVNSNAFTIGEVWTDIATTSSYYQKGNGLDMCFDFSFGSMISDAIGYQVNSAFTSYIQRESGAPVKFFIPFWANHDMVRFASSGAINGSADKARIGMAMLLTMPGMPFLYYGEEIAMKNGATSDDEDKRTPMPWDASATGGFTTGTPWKSFSQTPSENNVAAQKASAASVWSTVRNLIQLRKKYAELRSLTMLMFPQSATSVIAYLRKGSGYSIVVVVNLSSVARDTTLNFNQSGVTYASTVTDVYNNTAQTELSEDNYSVYPVHLNGFEFKLLRVKMQ